MKVYVAASWRAERQPEVVKRLREVGHEVYDFRESWFAWSDIDPDWQKWTPRQFVRALEHPLACKGFHADMAALKRADAVVLVQPSGRSAALEFGFAAGMDKVCIVLLAEGQEPELMFRMADMLTESLDDVVTFLSKFESIEA